MSKLRVHELAKELGKQNKEVMNYLTEKGITVKSHMSTIEEGMVDDIRKNIGKGTAKPATGAGEVKAQEASTATKPEGKEQTTGEPVKKKNISQVFRPQNSRTGMQQRPGQQRTQGQSRRPQGTTGTAQRPQSQQTVKAQEVPEVRVQSAAPVKPTVQPATASDVQTKPVSAQPAAAAVQHTAAKESQPVSSAASGSRPQETEQRPYHNQNSQGGQRPYNNQNSQGGQRPYNNQNSQGGQRPYNNQNSQGEQRPYHNQNSQGGQRTYNNQNSQGGQRTYNNQNSQGGQRTYNNQNSQGGQRTYNNQGGQGGQRPYNNQGGQGGQRPYNNQGGQGGQRPYNNQGGQGGQRPYNQGGQGGQRPYNQGGQGGQRPYNNQGGQGSQRPYNNQGGQGGQRPYNNQGGQGGQRPYNNGPRSQGTGSYGAASSAPKSDLSKPITKESRNRADKFNKSDKTDKFSKENKGNRPNQKNSNFKGGKAINKTAKPVKPVPQPVEKKEDEIKTIILPDVMTIKELADKMKIQAAAIVKKLFLQGTMVTVNHEIDYDKAEEIALEYNCIAEHEVKVDVIAELLKEDDDDDATLVARPPVVCVMGHVDHGKTSLLDAIRNTHVIAKEAGGITQHIGAYVVNIDGQKITFLDTPGHEAFTAMRMRGANSTDIAILVVAADDGVMPQTVEAINHAKAAGIEIIVAINKIDKPSANIERVKQELSEYELIPEDWGGSTIFVPVSAHTQEGMDQLLEMIILTAEVAELKANPKRKARGLVIEAELDKGKGPVATVLVQKGTLRVGDPIAAGSCFGKVRAMMDDKGRRVKEAGPSTPVEILGLSDVPNAGEIFVATDSDKEARSFAETFISQGREKLLEDTKAKMSLDDLFTQIKAGNLKEFGIIVKADVQGSVEAVKQSLLKLSNDEVVVKIIHGGVGAINESDVILASASNAIIIGFNVRPDATAKLTAEREGVNVNLYRVIYDAIADVEAAMKGMLDPVFEEKVLGHAEVRQTFKASGIGTIAGSYVLDGIFQRGCSVRITREGNQIFEGPLASLKRFKDDVKEVKSGYECGLVFEKFNDVQEFDQVEAYTMVEVPR
ncbi:MAG: translation initiation factor IF-2 [Clostridiales bacterium]|nr:translation initiation factor IF-2 [Clostridiales bacterium]